MAGVFKMNLKATIKFDAKAIESFLGKYEKKALQHVGAKARASAMKSITPAPPYEYANPGEPFHSHPARGKGDSGIAKAIRYAYSPEDHSVVVGPAYAQHVFKAQEEGGKPQRSPRRRERKIGDNGLVIVGRSYKSGKQRFIKTKRGLQPALFATIRNEKQLNHVRALEEEIYGPETFDGKPRPVFENVEKKHGNELVNAIREAYGR